MPAFLKNPKVIAGVIVVAWVAYIVAANFQPSFNIYLLPWPLSVELQLKVSTVIIASAIFGSLITLLIQYQWKRWNSSKPTSASAAGESSKTVA